MIVLKWLDLLPFDMAMKVVGLIAAPFVSLFVDKNGFLPNWLAWFETPDSNMFGYTGDMGFWEDHCLDTKTWLGRWWVCTLWQWRNTSHGFSVYVLGVDDRGKELVTKWESGEGDLKKYLKVVDGVGFDFKGSFKYPFIDYRFRWRFGWKLHQDTHRKAQYVFSISPIMKIED